MEWSRVKSILICVFVLVNLFLIRVYINSNTQTVTITEETINNTVLALKNNNIEADESMIPKKVPGLPAFNITNRHINCKDLSLILWKNAKSNGFDYFNPENTTFDGKTLVYKGQSGTDTIKDVKNKIKKTGALYGYKYQLTQKENTLFFTAVYENMLLYDCTITAELTDGTVLITMSNWVSDSFENCGYSSVITCPEALITFASEMKFKDTFKIKSIEQGYIAGSRDNEIQTKTATPVWKITGEDAVYYIDMRNGDLLDL
ncbi:MAG: two-component system regulatory protein YycI [Clostridia bacterium]|nr:two-component system regulatory protein YycI [Clostridia bacterium]